MSRERTRVATLVLCDDESDESRSGPVGYSRGRDSWRSGLVRLGQVGPCHCPCFEAVVVAVAAAVVVVVAAAVAVAVSLSDDV